jgi:hypothetical protein
MTAAVGLSFDGGVVAAMGMRSCAGNRRRASEFGRCSHGEGNERDKGRRKKMKKEERKKKEKKERKR